MAKIAPNDEIIRQCIDTYGFLPLPETFTKLLDWNEGDIIIVELVGDGLLLTKANDSTQKDDPEQ